MIFTKKTVIVPVSDTRLFERDDVIWVDLTEKIRGWHWVVGRNSKAKHLLCIKLSRTEIWGLHIKKWFRKLKR